MKSWNILIAGVGGQGTLLASKILGALAQSAGYDVKVSEVHGMAQRGGSVLTYVKMADRVYSPIIERGGADVLLAFEQLEALRYASHVKPGGYILANSQKIPPMPVIMGKQAYPEDIIGKLMQYNCKVTAVDALELAVQAGSARAVNTVMLGALSLVMDIEAKLWEDALRQCIPAKVLDINLKAFQAGKG
jgi:indolepyruvate ferredoxin oxidoreductase beta subunit